LMCFRKLNAVDGPRSPDLRRMAQVRRVVFRHSVNRSKSPFAAIEFSFDAQEVFCTGGCEDEIALISLTSFRVWSRHRPPPCPPKISPAQRQPRVLIVSVRRGADAKVLPCRGRTRPHATSPFCKKISKKGRHLKPEPCLVSSYDEHEPINTTELAVTARHSHVETRPCVTLPSQQCCGQARKCALTRF